MQKGKSRNVLASPLGEEGHEVAKGCTRVRMIMTLDMDVTAAGGQDRDGASYRRSALYTLLPLRGISPQGETRDLRRKTASHIFHVPFRSFPLWW